MLDVVEAAAPGAPLVHERIQVSDERRGLLRHASRSRGRTSATGSGSGTATPSRRSTQADVVVEGTYRTAAAQHAPMEPHATLARWDGERLEVWTGTQTPFNVRAGPRRRLRRRRRSRSGSSARRWAARSARRRSSSSRRSTAALARKAGRPVRVVLPRAEEWVTNNRHPSAIHVRLGARAGRDARGEGRRCLDRHGRVCGLRPGRGGQRSATRPSGRTGSRTCPSSRGASTRTCRRAAPTAASARRRRSGRSERLVDRLAERLGIDPLELRLRNVLRDGDTFCTGETMHDVHFADCLERAAEAVGWREGRRGKGLCVLLKGMQTPSRASIGVEADDDGGYTLRCATTEMGQGARRALRARRGRAARRRRRRRCAFPTRTPTSVPYDTRTTSSRSTYMMGGALEAAVRDLRANDGTRGVGEVRNDGRPRPGHGPGHRLLALAPGRGGGRGRGSTRRRARSRSYDCTPPSTRGAS